jgi:peptidoglycan/LPS O-acetylase OafA/YrhL
VVVITKLGETSLGHPFRRLAFLGNATYASYQLHFPLQLLVVIVMDAVGVDRNVFYSPFVFIAFMLLVFGLSLVVHRQFEMPAQDLIRAGVRYSLKRSAVRQAANP